MGAANSQDANVTLRQEGQERKTKTRNSRSLNLADFGSDPVSRYLHQAALSLVSEPQAGWNDIMGICDIKAKVAPGVRAL